MGSMTPKDDKFMDEVRRLRAAYMEKRDSTNVVQLNGRRIVHERREMRGDRKFSFSVYWFDREHDSRQDQRRHQCIRLAHIPNTMSGAILRLERSLPNLGDGDYDIIGNDIRPIVQAPSPPEYEDDSEDVSEALAALPEVPVDPQTCFLKKPKYRREIWNLLACQGGWCPGAPQSAHVVQLLGKSASGELIFEKMDNWIRLSFVYPLATYKEWILQLINGLQCLHAHGIVHRDICLANLVFSPRDCRLLICDLEGRWGNRDAPEISRESKSQTHCGWTEKTDIYDVGNVIKGMMYGNAPLTSIVERKIPSPLKHLVSSCLRHQPEERPTLEELRDMVINIQV